MAKIKAFRALRFNEEKIDDLSKVFSPPYDSIDEDERHALYDKDKYNIVRIQSGMKYDDDTDRDNCYTRAKKYLDEWIQNDILKRDEKPAIYLYEQKTVLNGVHHTTSGFVAALELTDDAQVVPCEKAIIKNLKDRAMLMEAVKANVSMIECMYIEPERYITNFIQTVSERKPDMVTKTDDGTVHTVWTLTDENEISYVSGLLKDETFFIVDGENRYQIGKAYKEKMMRENKNHTGDESYNYIMTFLTNANDDGFIQLPFHRMLRFPKGFREEFFVAAAQDYFKVEKIIVDTVLGDLVDTMKKQIATSRDINRFAVYSGHDYFYRLTLLDRKYIKDVMPDVSDSYLSLDVTVLNKLILEDIFNITEDKYIERVTYTKSIEKGMEELKKGTHQCIVCMNPVKAEQIRAVASQGEVMPERSICAYPKPEAGVLLNILD